MFVAKQFQIGAERPHSLILRELRLGQPHLGGQRDEACKDQTGARVKGHPGRPECGERVLIGLQQTERERAQKRGHAENELAQHRVECEMLFTNRRSGERIYDHLQHRHAKPDDEQTGDYRQVGSRTGYQQAAQDIQAESAQHR